MMSTRIGRLSGCPFPCAGKGKNNMSARIFTVNNRTYQAKEFDFNLLCDLEEQGLSLDDIDKKPMSLIRTYLAFCGNLTKENAGLEIERHIENGGEFSDVVEAMSAQMQDSGFFRSINKKSEAVEEETSTASAKKSRKA